MMLSETGDSTRKIKYKPKMLDNAIGRVIDLISGTCLKIVKKADSD